MVLGGGRCGGLAWVVPNPRRRDRYRLSRVVCVRTFAAFRTVPGFLGDSGDAPVSGCPSLCRPGQPPNRADLRGNSTPASPDSSGSRHTDVHRAAATSSLRRQLFLSWRVNLARGLDGGSRMAIIPRSGVESSYSAHPHHQPHEDAPTVVKSVTGRVGGFGAVSGIG